HASARAIDSFSPGLAAASPRGSQDVVRSFHKVFINQLIGWTIGPSGGAPPKPYETLILPTGHRKAASSICTRERVQSGPCKFLPVSPSGAFVDAEEQFHAAQNSAPAPACPPRVGGQCRRRVAVRRPGRADKSSLYVSGGRSGQQRTRGTA